MSQIESARRIGVAMTRLLRAAHRAKAQDAATGGSFQSMPVLWALRESGPLRSNLIAESVLSDPSTISRQVTTLVEQGLVAREPDPDDGRAWLLAITDSGRAVVEEKLRLRDEYLAGMTASWTDADRDRFVELFERFSTDFAAAVAADPRLHANAHPSPAPRTEKS
jgi:DNA-binding MarR family transcriptional regulator